MTDINTTKLVAKTVIIKKRGRKWFECLVGGYKAKLMINDASKQLKVDQVVRLHAEDISKRTSYGVEIKYDPKEVVDIKEAEDLRQAHIKMKNIAKLLAKAREDISQGMVGSKKTKKSLAEFESLLKEEFNNGVLNAGRARDEFESLSEAVKEIKKSLAANSEKIKYLNVDVQAGASYVEMIQWIEYCNSKNNVYWDSDIYCWYVVGDVPTKFEAFIYEPQSSRGA